MVAEHMVTVLTSVYGLSSVFNLLYIDSDVVRRCVVLPGRLSGEFCLSCQLTDDKLKAMAVLDECSVLSVLDVGSVLSSFDGGWVSLIFDGGAVPSIIGLGDACKRRIDSSLCGSTLLWTGVRSGDKMLRRGAVRLLA